MESNSSMIWTDQPTFDHYERMCTIGLPDKDFSKTGVIAQVNHEGEHGWALTVGNLFGSQTLFTKDLIQLLKLVDAAYNCGIVGKKVDIKDFPRVVLLDNRKRKE